MNLVQNIKDDPLTDLAELFTNPIRDARLQRTVDRFISLEPKNQPYRPVFDRAIQARNYIAHDTGGYDIYHDTYAESVARLGRLKVEVAALSAADNVISRWVYGLEEPYESVPRTLVDNYPDAVARWVFAPVQTMLS